VSEIQIPHDLWEEDIEGVVLSWLLDEGDEVEEGDAVAEIMVEKIQYEVLSPAAGILKPLKQPDDPVAKGDVIAELT
jgi:pyruvate/2-oxoglutarate dehydrogenase complex dihydrolipoamide acyltransferase (E2) component